MRKLTSCKTLGPSYKACENDTKRRLQDTDRRVSSGGLLDLKVATSRPVGGRGTTPLWLGLFFDIDKLLYALEASIKSDLIYIKRRTHEGSHLFPLTERQQLVS